ncbi:type II toxin-antitoxin system RelE/ParE family toxin [Azospirillum sp.]|uniref:type II toxin-antitoxin system RelE/ParE family toxin n=1 Tax=Azospirillum sp. TaxID=34012 RepID=UPI002D5A7876|nr:type II toxin-antitoxin system RelE/ParE family toxin [Azospirillum sp.]HYD66952.1 type II toxin-antitoxin system RelE/ParE family toxin [Azospirillum sp.]
MHSGRLHSVIETPAYLRKTERFLSEHERRVIVDMIAANPLAGDLIPEGGGIRKLRIPVAGRGKRGGARVIYYHHSERLPVFLLTAFAKNEQADLTMKERHALAAAVKQATVSYGRQADGQERV